MITKDKKIKVINKDNGVVGYVVPDLGIHRNFYPGESKDITYEELEKLSYLPGGDIILKELLEITDEEAVIELFSKKSEPEYHYTKEDVKQLLISGTLDQFLDCLDFAPEVIKDMVKDLAVDLPLNDMAKREAILNKLGFDVTKAIEIKNTKFDSGEEDLDNYGKINTRRTTPVKANTASSGRRYKPVTKNE